MHIRTSTLCLSMGSFGNLLYNVKLSLKEEWQTKIKKPVSFSLSLFKDLK